MSDALLLVRERQAGWAGHGTSHLLNEAEWRAYAALTRAGLVVSVAGVSEFLMESRAFHAELVIMAQPDSAMLGTVNRAMRSPRLMVLAGGTSATKKHLVNRSRKLTFAHNSESLQLAGRSLYEESHPLKILLAPPGSGSLRWEEGTSIEARWGASGGPAILRREVDGVKRWDLGMPVDRLSPGDLRKLLEMMSSRDGAPALTDPAPGAAVMLLHDVEEALPGDSRGIHSVRAGLEACLESQARYGLRATYNLVGTFAEQIPDLVQRIAREGHELASHGGSHRVIPDLDLDQVREEIEGAERRITSICPCEIRGFRSPRSRWNSALLDLLTRRKYVWNAEADPSRYPYRVPGGQGDSLIRIPVAADDWDYVRHGASPAQVTQMWKSEVERAIEHGHWVALGSHPSVLGVNPERLSAFADFMRWLTVKEVPVMTLGEGARRWLTRMGTHPGKGRASEHEFDGKEYAAEHPASRSL